MRTKIAIRNILYWVKRLVFDSILKRYTEIYVDISDSESMIIGKYARENEMTFNQAVESMLVNYIKHQKNEQKKNNN